MQTVVLKSLFNKGAGRRPETLLKRDPTQLFSCKICEIFKNIFFYRTPKVVVSLVNI